MYLDPASKDGAALPTAAEVKDALVKQVAALNAYVDEMNVPRRVVDDMMTIPSDSLKLLTVEDLFHYGILPVDPFVQEAREIGDAKTIGISHTEYLARRNLARRTCFPDRGDNPYLQGAFDDFQPCWAHIVHAPPKN